MNPTLPILDYGHGATVYEGVLVCWDEDYDKRILDFVDSLDTAVRQNLYACYEHEGCLELYWNIYYAGEYTKGCDIEIVTNNPDGTQTSDIWYISESKQIRLFGDENL